MYITEQTWTVKIQHNKTVNNYAKQCIFKIINRTQHIITPMIILLEAKHVQSTYLTTIVKISGWTLSYMLIPTVIYMNDHCNLSYVVTTQVLVVHLKYSLKRK